MVEIRCTWKAVSGGKKGKGGKIKGYINFLGNHSNRISTQQRGLFKS